MKITVNITSTVTGLSESKEYVVGSKTPIKIPTAPQTKVQIYIDGVKQTGNELVNGKRVILQKTGSDLMLTLDGEPLAQVEGFYAAEGASLDGGAWQFTSADKLTVQDGSLMAATPSSEFTPQVLPLVAATGAGGLVAVLGVVGLAATGTGGGGTTESPADALARIEAYNASNGVGVPAPTVDDYRIAGVTDVNEGNVAAVNAQVLKQDPGGANSVAKIQPLVAAAKNAIDKIEAYNNGTGINPAPLVPNDYFEAGITGVNENNVGAVNAQVLKQATGGADTAPKIQTLANVAIAAVDKIEAYNNGNGIDPAALKPTEYNDAGVTGVSPDNVAAVNAQVLKQIPGGANTPAKVQVLVTAGNLAIAKIENYNNSTGTPALQLIDYQNAGITGVNDQNLTAINFKVLSQVPGGADSVPKVQALVNTSAAAILKIEEYNKGNGTTPAPLELNDFVNAGIQDVSNENLAAVNAQVLKQADGGANTASKVQALVTEAKNALTKIENYNRGDGVVPPALELSDYTNAGITGVNDGNLTAVNVQVLKQVNDGADSSPEIQALVNGVNTAVTALSNFAQANTNGLAGATGTIPDATVFANAGLTGLSNTNLNAIKDALASALIDGAKTDTAAEIQTLINAYSAILASADGGTAPTSVALTTLQYTNIGVNGAATGAALSLLDNVVDGKNNDAVNTTAEVQALSDAAKAVMTGAAGGVAPNKAQLDLLGVTGVTDANLTAVQAAIAGTLDDGSAVDSLSELQGVVRTGQNNASSALAAIQAAAQNDSANETTPSAATYLTAGVTGVTATATGANPANLAAINTALNSLLVDGTKTDSVEKVQAIVNDYTAILRSADGGVATTTTPLTTAQYTRIGVADAATGAALGLLDNVIDGKANTAVDERNEVQKLSDAAKAVMTGAAGGAGPSQEQLELLGVTGVTPANLAAVQKAIADTLDDGSEVDLLSELKTVSSRGFTTAADALTQISIAARDDSANATTPSAATYALAGITGVSATASGTTLANLAAINSALNSGLIDGTKAGTVAGVQAIVNAYNLILRSADGQANNTTTALTGNQYADVGITGYSGTNTPPAEGSALHLLDNVVDLSNASAVNLYANLQLIATAAQHVMSGVAGGTAPDLNDLIRLGVTGVDNNTLATAQLAISRATNTDVDTLSELQRVIDGVLSNPTLSTLLNGVTNLEVDSKLVFSADQTVTVGTGNITITDLGGTTESGGTGYRGDTQTNTQVISMTNAVADGLVKIVGSGTGTKIIINPKWDLDLSSNYRISMDDGAFRDASGTHNMTGFTPVTFSTVKPGTHASGGTAASEAKASQYMTDGGILAAGKSWLDIEGIGDNTGTMQQLGDLSGGSYSLVMKNYATEIGKPSPDGGGSSGLDMHDTFVGVQNFGENDYLYFDAQLNDPTQQLFLPRFVGVSASGPTDSPKGLLGQTAVSLGVVATPEQVGNQAVIGLGFEGNTANKYYNSIGIVDGINGFATEWHKDSAPLIMG